MRCCKNYPTNSTNNVLIINAIVLRMYERQFFLTISTVYKCRAPTCHAKFSNEKLAPNFCNFIVFFNPNPHVK